MCIRDRYSLVSFSVLLGHDVSVLCPGSPVLHSAFERTECLSPLAIRTTVPEQPGTVGRPCYGHGATRGATDTVSERLAVLKVLRRDVAGAARDLAVATQSCIEEQITAERCGAGVVVVAVRWVAIERLEAPQGQRAKRGQLRGRPRAAAPNVANGDGRDAREAYADQQSGDE